MCSQQIVRRCIDAMPRLDNDVIFGWLRKCGRKMPRDIINNVDTRGVETTDPLRTAVRPPTKGTNIGAVRAYRQLFVTVPATCTVDYRSIADDATHYM
jgi:hypothetical protein